MNFTVEISDRAGSYIVRLEDGTCAMVNLDFPDTLERGNDLEELMNIGFWPYDDAGDPDEDTLKAIEEVLKANM